MSVHGFPEIMATLKLDVLTNVKRHQISNESIFAFSAISPDSNIVSVWFDEVMQETADRIKVNTFIALAGHTTRPSQSDSRLFVRLHRATMVSININVCHKPPFLLSYGSKFFNNSVCRRINSLLISFYVTNFYSLRISSTF